jgi:hypothetical protein
MGCKVGGYGDYLMYVDVIARSKSVPALLIEYRIEKMVFVPSCLRTLFTGDRRLHIS